MSFGVCFLTLRYPQLDGIIRNKGVPSPLDTSKKAGQTSQGLF
jgi:hypothetical protein